MPKTIHDSKWIGTLEIEDADGRPIELEVHWDPVAKAAFAIDATFVDQVQETVPSLYNEDVRIRLAEPKE